MRASDFSIPAEYPCPVCAELRDFRLSKKDKPYLVCDLCGVQVFIRGKTGIYYLEQLGNNSELWGKIKSLGIPNTSHLIQLSNRISYLEAEIQSLENGNASAAQIERLEKSLSVLKFKYETALRAGTQRRVVIRRRRV